MQREGPIPATVTYDTRANRLFWKAVERGIDGAHQANGWFHGDNVLVIKQGIHGELCFDHPMVCEVEPAGDRARLHASDGVLVSSPVWIVPEDVQVFISMFHVGVTSPAQFFTPPGDDSALEKDAGELRAAGGVDELSPAVAHNRGEYNSDFFNDHQPFFESKGVDGLMRGDNVLVLEGREGFQHTLVLAVGVCDRLTLHGSDGSVVDPALEVDAGDLAYFILHYHDRPEVSPKRFFETCLGVGFEEDEWEGDAGSSPHSTRDPAGNPQEFWPGNPRRDGRNPGALMALERAVACIFFR